MQRQLIRLRRRKRARKRVMIVVAMTFLMALALVGMRACTGSFDQSYNKAPPPGSPAEMMKPGNLDKLKAPKKFVDQG